MPNSRILQPGFAGLALVAVISYTLMDDSSASVKQEPGLKVDAAYFEKEVRPILVRSCITCHSGAKPTGGLSLTSRAGLMKGGEGGLVFDPAHLADSKIIKAVSYLGPQMPPSVKLPQKQIDAMAAWVKAGAPWSGKDLTALEETQRAGAPKVNDEARRFWSFKPVQRPAVPKIDNPAWSSNPIDSFVFAKLRSAGLKPNGTATRESLVRRATYDLTGLPPTPDEVRSFLADKSDRAYEKLIDRLLQSPQYGEKWGRHWLDLVRFAETNSYERDGDKPQAWRYRDYVIRSFNEDKPYDRFIAEQIAGDELKDRNRDTLIATGFYRLGIWDDEPSDPKQALYDDLDDILNTSGQVFLGLSIGCARCHDHKIDPMPQKDYYRMLAFLSGVKRFGDRSFESIEANSLRPIASPELVAQHNSSVRAHQDKVRANDDAIASIERKLFKDLSPVEKEEWRNEGSRTAIAAKRVGGLISQEELDRFKSLHSERRRLRDFRPPALERALCVTELSEPRVTHVLLRGNPVAEGDEVNPGFPEVLGSHDPVIHKPEDGTTSGRRLALANWLTSSSNPLTARVMANRIWQFHFGRGIVRTPSNFGYQGSRPTHPELLDWLASELVKGGWKMKSLHKQIMLSQTYRMSSASSVAAAAKDPDNDLFWRYDMRRLTAEEIRDSILAANGTLNTKMGGPSIYTVIPPEVLAGQSQPGNGWGNSSEEDRRRRSVYIFLKRSLVTPIIASFDGPDTDFSCPVRFATTQPTQALGMLNSTFVNGEARKFAEYLMKEAGASPEAQVKLALWRVWQRMPTDKEVARGVAIMAKWSRDFKLTPAEALIKYCVVALSTNEFTYLD